MPDLSAVLAMEAVCSDICISLSLHQCIVVIRASDMNQSKSTRASPGRDGSMQAAPKYYCQDWLFVLGSATQV